MHRLINILLLVMIGVVGWRVYSAWTRPDPPAIDDARGRGRQAPDIPQTARAPAPAQLAMSVAERDLFDESRRAPAETATGEPVVETAPPEIELVGVLMVGPEPEAVVRDTTGGGKPRHVVAGDDVEGYTVSRISATEVVLTSPAGNDVPLPLKLKLSGGAGGAGSTAPGRARRADAGAAKEAVPTAAGVQPGAAAPAAQATTAASVRERLRELRRQRREQANQAGR
jgi:hypothetical protein